jgi:putative copper export protein
MGHAAGSDRLLWLSVANDALHVATVGAWVGTLFMLAMAASALRAAARGGDAIAALITAFHPVAVRSSGLVIATGVVGLLLRVPHISSLIGSAYGTVFFVKACAVAAVAAFGASHARTGARRATRGPSTGVARSLAAEAAFAMLTILATAVFVGTDPPDTM